MSEREQPPGLDVVAGAAVDVRRLPPAPTLPRCGYCRQRHRPAHCPELAADLERWRRRGS